MTPDDGTGPSPSEVTQLLRAWRGGDSLALERLAATVEGELRRLADLLLRKEGPGHTLQPTALVNEAYLRLFEWKSVEWQSRAHFFAVAAKMMRRILVNQAEAKAAQKRGGATVMVSLSEAGLATEETPADVIALDDALNRLAAFDARKSQLVELRFFGGLNVDEVAEVMGMTARNVRREWTLTRAWLFRELSGTVSPDA
jgi:RNA polymerase sigma factor (TIGR02999 family)